MKKKFVAVLSAVLAVSMVATGCGRESVDYNVDGEGSGSSSGDGTLAAKYGIPDECDTKLDVGDSGLGKIEIYDLDVTYPDTGSMDITYYTLKEVTNESKKTIAETLFDKDEGIYEYDWENMTKEDIQRQIDWYKNMMESAVAAGYEDDIEYYEEDVEEYEEQLAVAPDEYPAAGDYSGDAFIGTMDGTEYSLSFDDNYTYLSMNEYSMTYRPNEDAEGAEGCYWNAAGDLDSEDLESLSNMCTLTQDEAQMIAEDFMAQIGVSDMMLTTADDLAWTYYDYEGNDIVVEKDGYYFKYARAINGVPVSSKQIWNVDNLQSDYGYADVPVETFTIAIDANGILDATWSYYLEATGDTEENVTLLTFDELLEVANETVAEYYTTYPSNYSKVDFNEIELTYFLEETDEEGVFKYVPAWVLSEYDSEYSDESYPSQMVVLDATDGSAIDLISLSKAIGGYYTYDDEDYDITEEVIIDDTIDD